MFNELDAMLLMNFLNVHLGRSAYRPRTRVASCRCRNWCRDLRNLRISACRSEGWRRSALIHHPSVSHRSLIHRWMWKWCARGTLYGFCSRCTLLRKFPTFAVVKPQRPNGWWQKCFQQWSNFMCPGQAWWDFVGIWTRSTLLSPKWLWRTCRSVKSTSRISDISNHLGKQGT